MRAYLDYRDILIGSKLDEETNKIFEQFMCYERGSYSNIPVCKTLMKNVEISKISTEKTINVKEFIFDTPKIMTPIEDTIEYYRI